MSKPVVIVNFKAYREVDGKGADTLATACAAVSEETGARIIAVPPTVELGRVARLVGIPVFAQNVDPYAPGSATGWITPSMVKACGAVGTLINHSEHQVQQRILEECVKLCKGCDLTTVICSNDVKSAVRAAGLRPDYVAVEPPELIGGDISVTAANPKIVEDTVEAVRTASHSVSVLCGAGVKTGKDVRTAVDLGAQGVLLASGVVKAKDPAGALRDLVRYI
ncbi:MAG: triose-phosphate isomerase [Candidatus Methanoplasma sp.]|jgi:triosephosphate isomerase|nr:triose-phosphate isomerase [Candidatus Methanoplasma sp.]